MKKRLAIIPARGGSKRISNKNIRDFCGKPMISYILQSASDSGLFDVVHVSTESDEIQQTVENLGFQIDFMRPSELADDHTPIMPVLKYVTNAYLSRGQEFDEIWLLMACSPLIEISDLQEAAKLFEKTEGRKSLLAVSEYPVPIEWAFCLNIDGTLNPIQPGMFSVRSQDLEKKYFDTGTFVVYTSSMIRGAEGAGSDTEFIGFVLSKGKSIDIDDEEDWAIAEALYSEKKQRTHKCG